MKSEANPEGLYNAASDETNRKAELKRKKEMDEKKEVRESTLKKNTAHTLHHLSKMLLLNVIYIIYHITVRCNFATNDLR
jgi:hypothetical protein